MLMEPVLVRAPGSRVPSPRVKAARSATIQGLRTVQAGAGKKKGPEQQVAGFQPPPGQPPLWWVEEFEKRRKSLANSPVPKEGSAPNSPATPTTTASTLPPSHVSQEPNSLLIPNPGSQQAHVPPPNESNPSNQQHTSNTQGGPSATSSITPSDHPPQSTPTSLPVSLSKPSQPPFPLQKGALALQLIQLTIVMGALIIFPATLQPGGLYCLRVWALYLFYWAMFAAGSVRRMAKHGPLSPQSKDKQRQSWKDRAALFCFIPCIVFFHWLPVLRFTGLGLYFPDLTLYEVIGGLFCGIAMWLHIMAGDALGKDWDRVVRPSRLVTEGVYKYIQHPLYTSYMLLFTGFAAILHSAPTALLLLGCCLMYYQRRAALESQILTEAFGAVYEEYAQRTKKFVPGFL